MQTPEEIGAVVLVKMKETAEAYIGHRVTHAVAQEIKRENGEHLECSAAELRLWAVSFLRYLRSPTLFMHLKVDTATEHVDEILADIQLSN